MITLLKFNLYLIEPRVEKDVVDGEERIRASKFLIQNNAMEGSTIVIYTLERTIETLLPPIR